MNPYLKAEANEIPRRIAAIEACIPEIHRQRHALRKDGRAPARVVLPECFDPGPGDGPWYDIPAQVLGLPITFVGATILVLP